MIAMIDIKKDSKGSMWTITRTDSEGFHRQLSVSESDMNELTRLWLETINIKI